MNSITKIFLCFITCLLWSISTQAQTVTIGNTTLTERDVTTGIQIPWEILWGPDDHIWVTERRGQVLRIEPETGNTSTILNIQSAVDSGGEPGMLGMALHPDFNNVPKVYLVYNYVVGGFNTKEKIVSFDWDGTNLVNEQTLLSDIPGGGIHNGSRLLITDDGKILMTTGDTGNSSTSQDLGNLSGKVLRMNLDGSIPDDNPIANSYVYSFGHRNAQGLCHGPNGLIYSTEHGAQQSDEFNIIEVNRNYGWPIVQGACNTSTENNFCELNNVREPLMEWSPCVAVNGIEYYNHPAIPEFQNSVLMAVLGGLSGGAERISQLKMNEDGTEIVEENIYFTDFGRLRDVCINPYNGAIYIATNGPGYPGNGPNRIIEYRNLDYVTSHVSSTTLKDQFIKIWPNPISGNGKVEFSESFIGKPYEMISFSGQVVKSGIVKEAILEISGNMFTAGTYYVKATNERGIVTKVFIVNP